MFGDWDWRGHRYQEQHARLQQWLGADKRLVIIEIGLARRFLRFAISASFRTAF